MPSRLRYRWPRSLGWIGTGIGLLLRLIFATSHAGSGYSLPNRRVVRHRTVTVSVVAQRRAGNDPHQNALARDSHQLRKIGRSTKDGVFAPPKLAQPTTRTLPSRSLNKGRRRLPAKLCNPYAPEYFDQNDAQRRAGDTPRQSCCASSSATRLARPLNEGRGIFPANPAVDGVDVLVAGARSTKGGEYSPPIRYPNCVVPPAVRARSTKGGEYSPPIP